MPISCRGRIVWVELPDPRGGEPKCRPAVILTADADIIEGGTVDVAGVSTRSMDPPREVALPWHADGKVRTKLRKPCWAKADWVATVPLAAIQEYAGMVPPSELAQLLALIGSG